MMVWCSIAFINAISAAMAAYNDRGLTLVVLHFLGFAAALLLAMYTEGKYIKRIELLEKRVDDLENKDGEDDG